MPNKLRVLFGEQVVKILEGFGFSVSRTSGSHIVLKRFIDNKYQTLVVPKHSDIGKGTIRAIIRQSEKYILLIDLHKHFFTD